MSTRFFRNARGERLAYVMHGSGPTLVFPAWWVSHLDRNSEDPAFADFFARLGESFRCVRYDRFGVGLSDRGARAYSLETELEDLEALLDHLAETRLALFGFSCGAPVALVYAAKHPERVSRVVCYGAYAEGGRIGTPQTRSALASLVRAHWGMGSKALADVFQPDADTETLKRFAALQRDSANAETAARLLELTYVLDVTACAKDVRAPVLVLHRRGDRAIPHGEGRDLAARLPNATFVTLEGNSHLPWAGDASALLKEVEDFLGVPPSAGAPEVSEVRRKGEVWTLRYGGREVQVRDAKGLGDLARLLSRPGEEIHVTDLLGDAMRAAARAASAQPLADRQALADYRQRLAELGAALDEAQGNADVGTVERLSEEREALLRELGRTTGLGGRARCFTDPVERARKAVTSRIRETIRRIDAVHPPLGAHLQAAVITGIFCAYRPEPSVKWNVLPGAS